MIWAGSPKKKRKPTVLKNSPAHELDAHLIRADSPKGKMKPIEDLFAWYEVGLDPETKYNNTSKLGAEVTTRIISAAFRACRTQTTQGSSTVAQSHLSQDELFERIRRALDQATCIQDTPDLGYNLHARYFRPSYAAKYWLNRYFALTVRMHVEHAERQKRRFTELSWEDILRILRGTKVPPPNWVKLPEKDEVKRLAVIYVRCTPPSNQDVGRVMDQPTLQHVARTIANVNRAVEVRRQNPQQSRTGYTCLEPFSHVLLYGDFNHKEAGSIRTKIVEELEKCETEVRLA